MLFSLGLHYLCREIKAFSTVFIVSEDVMRVTSIVENTSRKGLATEHGLSLYIQKEDGQNVLFDMGQSDLFAANARVLGLPIADIDVAVVSHGHYDHGGGLQAFLQQNNRAMVFIHRDAFLPHYSLRETGLQYIGLEAELMESERLILCDDETSIGANDRLFAHVQGECCFPVGNRLLYGPTTTGKDSFSHEQNLLISEGTNLILFAGCAHRGIVNIIRKAEELAGKPPTHVFAGMHLVKSGLAEKEEAKFIASLAAELTKYRDTHFYTMHCTGEEQFQALKSLMGPQIEYLSCGDAVTIAE